MEKIINPWRNHPEYNGIITLTEPPTGKRKQYDKEGEEMTNEREQSFGKSN